MIFNKKFYLIGSIVIILIFISGLFFYFHQSILSSKNNPIANQTKTSTGGGAPTSSQPLTAEVYTNKNGQKWTLDDKADLIVSSAPGAKITFLESQIDPLKVHPGDTQKMKIIIKSDNGIASITANIETDNGINKVKLKKTGLVSVKDLNPLLATYVVDKNNQLNILSPKEALAYRQKEINAENNSSINYAQASSGEREIWEGSWTVKDTSVKTYNTTFVATDSQGNQDKLVLAWSDPCKDTNEADWQPNSSNAYGDTLTTSNNNPLDNCSIASIYGVDGANLKIDAINIMINGGGELILNPGKQISMIDGGKIVINSAGVPKGSFSFGYYLWAQDSDGDGYAASDTRYKGTSPTTAPTGSGIPSGLVRQNTLISNTLDCYDNNYDARPGQTSYFDTNRGDGSFDYNCSGAIEYQYPDATIGGCYEIPYAGFSHCYRAKTRIGEISYYFDCQNSQGGCDLLYMGGGLWKSSGTALGCHLADPITPCFSSPAPRH
jgi:hypothetical protein